MNGMPKVYKSMRDTAVNMSTSYSDEDQKFLAEATIYLHGQNTGKVSEKSLIHFTLLGLSKGEYEIIRDIHLSRKFRRVRRILPVFRKEAEGKIICDYYYLYQEQNRDIPFEIGVLGLKETNSDNFSVKIIMHSFEEMDWDKQLAISMATHPRIGMDSPFRLLPPDLLRDGIMAHFSHVKNIFHETADQSTLIALITLIAEKRTIDGEIRNFYGGSEGEMEKEVFFLIPNLDTLNKLEAEIKVIFDQSIAAVEEVENGIRRITMHLRYKGEESEFHFDFKTEEVSIPHYEGHSIAVSGFYLRSGEDPESKGRLLFEDPNSFMYFIHSFLKNSFKIPRARRQRGRRVTG
jgi:hypothetical protein